MNILEEYLEKIIQLVSKNLNNLKISNLNSFQGTVVEVPPQKFNFDLSCNVALILAKQNKQNPNELADKIKKILLSNVKDFSTVEVANPGFLNIKLKESVLQNIVSAIHKKGSSYGSNKKNKKYNIEFVSANPTGPMHIGHCRGAILGDVLSNLLKFNGNSVTKEYYINDFGGQIINFTKSVFFRIREIKYNEKFKIDKDLYPGEYIKDIANEIYKKNPNINLDNFEKLYKSLSIKSLKHSMNLIKSDLKNLGIKHDNFVSETELVKNNLVDKTIKTLKKDNYVTEGYLDPPKGEENKDWKKIKRLIFKSTLFGDDVDRSLQKNDGAWTYFANDVAYHSDKVSRKYDYLINILGADHTGYTKRISAAVSALSNKKVILICKVCQLVKLFKKGKPFKMSKRSGEFISVNDLLQEVDKDSIRFMMLNRSNDIELDFDFDKVLEKSKDNPVFYVQYCYARINSLFRTLKLDLKAELDINKGDFKLNDIENKLLRKIFDWPKVVASASNKFEPHRIPFYLYDLATLFHSYWSKGNENEKYKFIINGKINNLNTLAIIKIVAIVIENGMNILGVSLPKKM